MIGLRVIYLFMWSVHVYTMAWSKTEWNESSEHNKSVIEPRDRTENETALHNHDVTLITAREPW